MKQELNIIKIGGNILDDTKRLNAFLRRFASLPGCKMLVHGGGKIATAIGRRLGIESKYEQGRRITDAATLDLVTMVYGGLLNKQLVAGLQALGCNAIGLTGADADIIRARRRPAAAIDFGHVGDIAASGVSAGILTAFLRADLSPVIAPLTHDGGGSLLNTNADTIAQECARAVAPDWDVRLVYCFEKAGVLRDAADESTVIPAINSAEFERLLTKGLIHDGMIPKLQNALSAIDSGVSRVVIGSADSLSQLIAGTMGTQIL